MRDRSGRVHASARPLAGCAPGYGTVVVVELVLVDDVEVVVLVVVHSAQQLPLPLGVPPLVWHASVDATMVQRVPQSASAAHDVAGSFTQVPLAALHGATGTRQATASPIPQVERAAQLTIRPLHRRGMTPLAASVFRACATQLT